MCACQHFRGFHMVLAFRTLAVNSINFELQSFCCLLLIRVFSSRGADCEIGAESSCQLRYRRSISSETSCNVGRRTAVRTSIPSPSNYQHVIARRRVSLSTRTSRARRQFTDPGDRVISINYSASQSHAGCLYHGIESYGECVNTRVACFVLCLAFNSFFRGTKCLRHYKFMWNRLRESTVCLPPQFPSNPPFTLPESVDFPRDSMPSHASIATMKISQHQN